MARSYVLGGVSATGLATGKPYFKRIVRLDGKTAASDRSLASPESPGRDGLTCAIDGDGAVKFNGNPNTDWGTGELLFVEFPATTRTLSVQVEEVATVSDNAIPAVNDKVRVKVMLTAPNQKVIALDSNGVATSAEAIMEPIENGNFIEIGNGDTATINARTKGVFILIENYDVAALYKDGNGGAAGVAPASRALATPATVYDYISLLVTAVLDHEGFDGSNGVQTKKIDAGGNETQLNKIWPLSTNSSDGVG